MKFVELTAAEIERLRDSEVVVVADRGVRAARAAFRRCIPTRSSAARMPKAWKRLAPQIDVALAAALARRERASFAVRRHIDGNVAHF